MKTDLTQQQLNSILDYNPDTGVFTYKVDKGRMKAGSVAGKTHKNGYRVIRINQGYHYAHRLAWLYMTGAWPKNGIDHRNRSRGDNRFCNLREATQAQNLLNQAGRRGSGAKGVHWHKASGAWRVRVTVGGVAKDIAYFQDFDLAELVATEARATYHGAFSCN